MGVWTETIPAALKGSVTKLAGVLGIVKTGFMGVVGVLAGFAAPIVVVGGALWVLNHAIKASQAATMDAAESLAGLSDRMNKWEKGGVEIPSRIKEAGDEASKFGEQMGKIGYNLWDYIKGPFTKANPIGRAIEKLGLEGEEAVEFGKKFAKNMREAAETRIESGKIKKTPDIQAWIDELKAVESGAIAPEKARMSYLAGLMPNFQVGFMEDMVENAEADADKMSFRYQMAFGIAEKAAGEFDEKVRTAFDALRDKNTTKNVQAVADALGVTATNAADMTIRAEAFLLAYKEADNKVAFVAEHIEDQVDNLGDSVDSVEDMNKRMDERLKKGEDIAAIIAGEKNEVEEEVVLIAKQEALIRKMLPIHKKIAMQKQKVVDAEKKELDARRAILALKETEVQIAKLEKKAEWFKSGGLEYGGAVHGPALIEAEMKAASEAKAAEDPKKYEEHLNNARKLWVEMTKDVFAIDAAMAEVGPNATPAEKYASALKKAGIEANRKKSDAAMWDATIAKMTTDEEKAIAEKAKQAALYTNELKRQSYLQEAATIKADEEIGMMKARRSLLEAQGYSASELLSTDLAILEAERQRLENEGKTTEEVEKRIEKIRTEKAAAEDMMNTAESKLSLLQKMGERGLISEEAIESHKKHMAAAYAHLASQQKQGSAEQFALMQKSLEMLGGDTEDKWDGIIGRVIGAPDALIKDLVSEGRLVAKFGSDVAGGFGAGGNVSADIINQGRREVTYRVKFDLPLSEVDRRMGRALEQGIEAFAIEVAGALK